MKKLLAVLVLLVAAAGCASVPYDSPYAGPRATVRLLDIPGTGNGFLYAIKVTPKGGKPYFLVRADGDSNFIRSDNPDMLIPQWEIFSW